MVVLLANKFFYEKGGSERYLFMQADALRERGHKVVDFSMSHPDNRPSDYSQYFVSHRDFATVPGPIDAMRRGATMIRSGEAARNLRRLIDDTRPDIAHLHNIYHQLTPSILPVLKAHGIPIVLTLHDYKLVCPNYRLFSHGKYCERCLGGNYLQAPLTRCNEGSFFKSLMLGIEAYVQRFTHVYDHIDLLLAPSRYMRDVFVRAGFSPERVLYLPSFLPSTATDSTAPDSLPADYLLYFGRLSEEKGLGTMLEAAAQAGDPAIVFCGDGPMRDELELQAKNLGLTRAHFLGHIKKDALDGIVRGARAVVVPSEWPENAPFTVLEAAVAGVPVIVSDVGGLPEMAEIISGIVVPAGDVAALSAAISDLWNDREGARARGEAGRKAALMYWDKTAHMEALEDIYASLTAVRSR